MCPISFSIKRLHLAGLRLVRPKIRAEVAVDLTPARLDLLRIVQEHDLLGFHGGVAQGRIVELLDLHPAVVSRTLKRLEELGYVVRTPIATDRRQKLVELTPHAHDALEGFFLAFEARDDMAALMQMAFRPGARGRVVWSASSTPTTEPRDAHAGSLVPVYAVLVRARLVLRDRAPFFHPWTIRDVGWPLDYSDPAHPFQVAHRSSLRIDDLDPRVASLFRDRG